MLAKRPDLEHPSLADLPLAARRAVEALAIATDAATEAAARRYEAAALAARLLREAGLSQTHIGEILNVTHTRVQQWLAVGGAS